MKTLQSMRKRSLEPARRSPREGALRPAGMHLNAFLRTALLAILATVASLSWGEPIGRLFFTPNERSILDHARLTGSSTEQGDAPTQQSDSLTLNGIIKRSSGKTTVWINNSAQNEADLPPDMKKQANKARPPDFPVLVQKTGKTVMLKVGQTLNIDSGEIRENYQPPLPGKEVPPSLPATSEAKTPDTAVIASSLLNHS